MKKLSSFQRTNESRVSYAIFHAYFYISQILNILLFTCLRIATTSTGPKWYVGVLVIILGHDAYDYIILISAYTTSFVLTVYSTVRSEISELDV